MSEVELKRKVRYATCEICKKTFPRDELHSVNVKFYSPDDRDTDKISIRPCQKCVDQLHDYLSAFRWMNNMWEEEVPISEAAIHQASVRVENG